MRSTDELARRQASPPGGRPARRPARTARAPKDWCEMPAATQPATTQPNATDARCEALFASTLQPSDAPTADLVAEAITCTMRQLGIGGCVGQMAQEFGEHPDLAAERMRWARQLAAHAAARPQAGASGSPASASSRRKPRNEARELGPALGVFSPAGSSGIYPRSKSQPD